MENLDIEIWKDIPGYEGLYQISNFGNVKSLNYNRTGKERIKKTQLCKGYVRAYLCKNSIKTWHRVHRLVYEAFIGPIPDGMQVNHIDENKQNNRIDNLNLMTPKENMNWGSCNERRAETLKHTKPSKSIICEETGIIYRSIREAWRQTEIFHGSICKCCKGKVQTAGGYHWKYAE